MFRSIARKPISKTGTYLKFGFVIMENESHLCPRCGKVLNAGPNYQPKYCDQCGQKINFAGIDWKKEKKLGYTERGDGYESFKDRVV